MLWRKYHCPSLQVKADPNKKDALSASSGRYLWVQGQPTTQDYDFRHLPVLSFQGYSYSWGDWQNCKGDRAILVGSYLRIPVCLGCSILVEIRVRSRPHGRGCSHRSSPSLLSCSK